MRGHNEGSTSSIGRWRYSQSAVVGYAQPNENVRATVMPSTDAFRSSRGPDRAMINKQETGKFVNPTIGALRTPHEPSDGGWHGPSRSAQNKGFQTPGVSRHPCSWGTYTHAPRAGLPTATLHQLALAEGFSVTMFRQPTVAKPSCGSLATPTRVLQGEKHLRLPRRVWLNAIVGQIRNTSPHASPPPVGSHPRLFDDAPRGAGAVG